MDYSYAAAAKSLQSCPTLCDPIDGSPPGKNTGVGCHFLLQCMKVKVKSLSPVQLLVTPWTAAHQAPLSMGFSRQEYWSGVPLPSPYELSVITRILKSKSEVAQSCVTLCNPMDCSPPGSSVHGILRARVLEWGAIFYSRGHVWPRD